MAEKVSIKGASVILDIKEMTLYQQIARNVKYGRLFECNQDGRHFADVDELLELKCELEQEPSKRPHRVKVAFSDEEIKKVKDHQGIGESMASTIRRGFLNGI